MALGLRNTESTELIQRTKWYAYVRLLFLLTLAIPGNTSYILINGFNQTIYGYMLLSIVVIASNFIFFVLTLLSRSVTYHRSLGIMMISLDVILITFFIYINGGVESRGPILYAVPILVAAALFGRKAIYLVAGVSSLLYVTLVAAQYFGVIQAVNTLYPELSYSIVYVVNAICFFPPVLFVIALAIDFITSLLSQKQAELSDSLDALETAQEIARLGSWEWDIARDEIVWSKELYRIYGVDGKDMRLSYDEYLKMLRPDEASTHSKVVQNAMKKRVGFNIDHTLTMPDGTVKYIHGEGRPVRDKSGNVVKMSGTAQDVTQVYHLDVAKQEFVSLASHQLRTPASGVKAFLSLLIDGYAGKLSKKQLTFAKKAFDSNNRQLEIIDNLLSLASIESGKLTIRKEPTDLRDIIKESLAAHKPRAREQKQKLHYVRSKTPLNIRADSGTLHMAVDNLISNALKYSPQKEQVTITTRENKGFIYLDVEDNGIGIAKKDMSSLFQKFSRLSDPASKTVGGSGLGLYMAKYIVELHGGKLLVHSEHGVGTKFTIKLPRIK